MFEHRRPAAAFDMQDVQQALAFQGPLDREYQVFLGDRLDQVVIGPLPQALNRRARIVDGGDHDALGPRAVFFDRFEQPLAVQLRHADIDQGQIEGLLALEKRCGAEGVVQRIDRCEPGRLQAVSDQIQVVAIVVDYNDTGSHGG